MKRFSTLLLIWLALVAAALPAGAQGHPADAYFEGAVFVGDSIMQQIGRYKMEQGEKGRPLLGNARFMTVSSYTLYQGSRITPLEHKAALRYAGRRVSLADALKKTAARKAFILLGLNDQAGSRLDQEMQMYTRLIERAQDKNPGVELIILSVTPIIRSAQTKALNQKNFDAFNQRLEALCETLGVLYLDVATPLKDEDGFLNKAYAQDGRVHLSQEGMAVFVKALYAFAESRH